MLDSSVGGELRVFVLVSVRLYREGLADALRHAGLDVIGVAAAWQDALAAIDADRPDVAVLDVVGQRGREIVSELRRRIPHTRVVVLAIDEIERDVLAWAEAGVSGYVTREGSVNDLIRAVTAAARREAHCAPQISGALLEHVHTLAVEVAPPTQVEALTAREQEVGELLEAGLSNKQIAARLQIELATVKNHVHSILAKLHVDRRTDAAAEMRRAHRAFLSII